MTTYAVEVKNFKIGRTITVEITLEEAKKKITKRQFETLMEREIVNTKYGLLELKRVD